MWEQKLLDAIHETIKPIIEDQEEYSRKRRVIKDLFLQRDFQSIFTGPKSKELLPTYAAEYLGGRALCYSSLFKKVIPFSRIKTVACFGAGNGAELCGLAMAVSLETQVVVHDISSYEILAKLSENLGCDHLQVKETYCNLLDFKPSELDFLPEMDLICCCFVLNELISVFDLTDP